MQIIEDAVKTALARDIPPGLMQAGERKGRRVAEILRDLSSL